jgi:hypothetical protein
LLCESGLAGANTVFLFVRAFYRGNDDAHTNKHDDDRQKELPGDVRTERFCIAEQKHDTDDKSTHVYDIGSTFKYPIKTRQDYKHRPPSGEKYVYIPNVYGVAAKDHTESDYKNAPKYTYKCFSAHKITSQSF